MKYKLVAIDMDGTLLDSSNQISRRTVRAIKRAEEDGIYIVMTTGRILKSVLYYSQLLDLKSPLIACNGAIVLDGEKNVIYENPLEKSKVKDIINLAELHKVYFHFYGKTKLYSNVRLEEVLRFYRDENEDLSVGVNIFNDIEQLMEEENLNIYKFIFIDNNLKKLKDLRQSIDRIQGIDTTSSWVNNIEAMNFNVSKGRALEGLCRTLNIKREEVLAIGDSENDLSMLEFAGLGVVMENGCQSIKKQFDYIADSNDEDGVAKVIEKFILK